METDSSLNRSGIKELSDRGARYFLGRHSLHSLRRADGPYPGDISNYDLIEYLTTTGVEASTARRTPTDLTRLL